MHAASISPLYIKSSMKGAIRKGFNAQKILQDQGLPPQILTNSKLRISTLDFAKFSQALMRLLEDEDLALLAQPSSLGSFNLLAKACLCSRDLSESLRTYRDGLNWLNSSTSSFMKRTDNGGYIAIQCEKAEGLEDETYIIEKSLSTCHRFHCWLTKDFIPIERVDLSYPEPKYSEEHRYVFYGAPVHYNQSQNALYFSEKAMKLEVCRSVYELREMLKQPYVDILTQARKSKSNSIKVRLWMESLFRDGKGLPQLSEAASYLGMSEQTLRRRLNADGYSFSQLKEDTRRDMAIYYIKQSSLSIEEISFRLGFSEGSTFIRAFKSWTGITPLNYRKM